MVKWKKVNISTTRRSFEDGFDVAIKPNKLRFELASVINKLDFTAEKFDAIINGFKYYNCSNETGKRVQYYIVEV